MLIDSHTWSVYLFSVFAFCALSGCDSASSVDDISPVFDAGEDTGLSYDAFQQRSDLAIASIDMSVENRDAVVEPDTGAPSFVSATDYCETTVDMFCEFYLRCGRMAADSLEECRDVFLETCNERYEPIYVSLVDAGFLALSASGIDSCRAHLGSIECERQVFDLDEGCAQMWVGPGAEGEPCSVGIESFVCGPALSCEIGGDLCGECRTSAFLGKRCSENQDCVGDYACIEGECAPRGRPGDACEDSSQCTVGVRCEDGTCRNFIRAAVGEPCDRVRRCPYRSVCTGGVCVKTAALGQPCTPNVGCMSGYCDVTCQPLKALGAPCESAMECRHARCTNGLCGPAISSCLTRE